MKNFTLTLCFMIVVLSVAIILRVLIDLIIALLMSGIVLQGFIGKLFILNNFISVIVLPFSCLYFVNTRLGNYWPKHGDFIFILLFSIGLLYPGQIEVFNDDLFYILASYIYFMMPFFSWFLYIKYNAFVIKSK